MIETKRERALTRRTALRSLGAAMATLPLAKLLSACGGSTAAAGTGAAGGAATTTTAATTTATTTATVAADAGGWATGGTAAMTAKASYPNPFASGAPTSCPLTCEMTEGPCYDSASVEIQDISYGYDGLPMRMVFQVVDDTCKPVEGAILDVWHVSAVGKYSGDDAVNEDIAFCTGNDATFTSHLYFRGKQTTDANGLATFDSCFPGWYSSRTVHVHMTVTVDGQSSVTTQLFFEDSLDDEIIDTQPLYDTRGKRDTTNETDTVITAAALPGYLFTTEKMSDGAMLAYKTIVLRASTTETACAIEGSGGGGGGGGDGGPGGPGGDGAGPPPPDGG
jgi:protocatechuate 3,4-dioxygenase beta subunit